MVAPFSIKFDEKSWDIIRAALYDFARLPFDQERIDEIKNIISVIETEHDNNIIEPEKWVI